jgi:pSer/pThr/pTyr-binding forkhead associated (FHA) protein
MLKINIVYVLRMRYDSDIVMFSRAWIQQGIQERLAACNGNQGSESVSLIGVMNLETEQKPLPGAAVLFLDGPLANQMVALQKPVTTIGRDRLNDIVVLDPTVSRQHARIRWLDDVWIIENLSQHSPLSLDKQRVQQGNLQHQSQVQTFT